MPTVKSKDGTAIAYERQGSGPALIVVDGALGSRSRTTAKALAGVIPNATYKELPGQRHDVDAKVLAPVLSDFFCEAPAGVRR